MKKLTGSAEKALKEELDRYKRFIMNRSSFYADLDESNVIGDSYIQKAAKEYNSNYTISRYNVSRVNTFIDIFVLFIAVTFLTFGIYCIIFFPNMVEHFRGPYYYFYIIIAVLFFAAFIYFGLYYSRRKKRIDSEKERRILKFLNKWDELEYVLQNMYEKKYEKPAGNIKDLLFFYIGLPEVNNSERDISIFSLLEYRNKIIHMKTDRIDLDMLDSSIKKIDDILDVLKEIEVVEKKNELLKQSTMD